MTTHMKPSSSARSVTPKPKTVVGRFFRRIPPTVYFSAIGVILLALIPLSIWFTQQANRETGRADGAEAKSAAVASPAAPAVATVDELCKKDDELARDLAARGACAQAAKAKEVITSEPVPTAPAGLTVAQVQSMIAERLSALPRPLTVEQVSATAAAIYATNRPADGKDATPEMVAAQVAAYCANSACVGKDGKDAPPVTDAQVYDQVVAYCNARDDKCVGERGPEGKQGPQGISFQRQYFARDSSGECFSFVEMYNPADNGTTTHPTSAGDSAS